MSVVQNYWVNRIHYTSGLGTTPQSVGVDASNNIYVSMYYLVTGPNYNVMVAKFNTSGTLLWSRHINTTGTNVNEFAQGLSVTPTGDVYLVGYTNAASGSFDMLVVKWDTNGNQQWQRTFGTGFADSAARSAVDSSGNLYIAGVTAWPAGGGFNSNEWVVLQISSSGNLNWQRTIGSSNPDVVGGLAVGDSFLILTGYRQGTGIGVVFSLYKDSGSVAWVREFTSVSSVYSCKVDANANIYIAGTTSSLELVLIKYDYSGNFQWSKKGAVDNGDRTPFIALDGIGDIYVHSSINNGTSALLARIDTGTGDFIWSKTIASAGADWALGIVIDYSGAIVCLTQVTPGTPTETLVSRLPRNGDYTGAVSVFTFTAASYSLSNAFIYSYTMFEANYTLTYGIIFQTTPTLSEASITLSATQTSLGQVVTDPEKPFLMFG